MNSVSFLRTRGTMDLVFLVCLAMSVGSWFACAERHSVYWNGSNPNFLLEEYAVEVHINDYLDIVCPHYAHGEVSPHAAERYVLYMVEKEDYEVCKPHSFDQLRWECSRPFAPHVPEKFSEKFQRFTPFTLGKEFKQGESYYYISKPMHHHGQDCLRLRVEVVGPNGAGKHNLEKVKAENAKKNIDGGKVKSVAAGGVHNPANRLPADDPAVMEPKVQMSIGSSGAQLVSFSLFLTALSVLLAHTLH
ncbi:ephrin-A1b [Spinachia spinachia]